MEEIVDVSSLKCQLTLFLPIPQDSIYFRVNYEKFNVHILNSVKKILLPCNLSLMKIYLQIIERAVAEQFNKGASLVIRAVLEATEGTQLKLSEPRTCKHPFVP